jgi:RND family efflux transporter MFP subunit
MILATAILVAACSKSKKENSTQSVLDESAIAVKVVPVEKGTYHLPISSSGLISTETESRLSFKVPGIITKILVKEGDAIANGQLLASLDLTEIDAQVSQAKNNLDKTKRDLERGQRLLKDSAATLEQFQNLQTAFNVAEESYRIASFNRQYSTIHALSAGRIIKKFASEGELASAGTPIFIVNTAGQNNWIVKVGLPDVDWVRVSKGDKVVVTNDAYPGVELTGEVGSINEGAELITGLYQVEIKIYPGKRKLASGLFAKVTIIPESATELWSIPIEAIVEGQGKMASVFVIQPDQKTVKKVPVQIAYLENKKVYITKGLEGINEVVAAGSAFLTENSSIVLAKN